MKSLTILLVLIGANFAIAQFGFGHRGNWGTSRGRGWGGYGWGGHRRGGYGSRRRYDDHGSSGYDDDHHHKDKDDHDEGYGEDHHGGGYDDYDYEDHLYATKARLDNYLDKRNVYGKRRLRIQFKYLNSPLEYEYLGKHHGIRHPLTYTPIAPIFGFPYQPWWQSQAKGHGANQQYGQAQPAQQYGQAQPAQPYAQPKPVQPYTQPKPAQPYAQPKPAQPYAQPKPAQPYAQPKPAQQYGRAQQEYQAPASYYSPPGAPAPYYGQANHHHAHMTHGQMVHNHAHGAGQAAEAAMTDDQAEAAVTNADE